MKLGPATTIVLAMFGTFAIVLTVMIVLMRPVRPHTAPVRAPGSTTATAGKPEPGTSSSARAAAESTPAPGQAVDTLASAATPSVDRPQEQPESPPASPRGATPQPPVAGRVLQRRLEQEQKEMRLLKAEMEKRLQARLAERKAKIEKLAGSCAALPAGEAAQVLAQLDDQTIAAVLKKMDRKAALRIAAVLQRLGRQEATAF